jgi:hypothetical protein
LLRLSLNSRMRLGTATPRAPRAIGTAPKTRITTMNDDFEDLLPNDLPTPSTKRARKARHVPDLPDDAKIPPTEPQVMERQQAEPAPIATVRIAPDELTHGTAPAALADEGAWYWIGLLPGAPSSCVTLAGLAFPLRTEVPFVGINDPRDQERVAVDGDMLRLTAEQVREIAAQVRRRAVRFAHAEGGEFERDRARQGYMQRIGTIVKYTSQEDVSAAREQGRHIAVVAPRQGDIPLSQFVYCILVPEANPRPRWAGTQDLPRPMSETGIELPAPGSAPLPPGSRVNLERVDGMRPFTSPWSAGA